MVAARSLILLAVLCVASGCGSVDELAEPPQSLALSVKATAEAGSARAETVTVMEGWGTSHTYKSSAVYDYRNARSETTYDFQGRRSRVIAIGGTSYAELDPSDAFEIAPGKRWIRNSPLSEADFEPKTNPDCDPDSA